MAANLLGTTGNWGIPNDQDGLILYEQSCDFSQQQKEVLTPSGEIQGLALYQPRVEVKISGLVAKTSPFASKIGVALALANPIPGHLEQTGGTTIIMGISRILSNAHHARIIRLTNPGAVMLIVPPGLFPDFNCAVLGEGVGGFTITVGDGVTRLPDVDVVGLQGEMVTLFAVAANVFRIPQ